METGSKQTLRANFTDSQFANDSLEPGTARRTAGCGDDQETLRLEARSVFAPDAVKVRTLAGRLLEAAQWQSAEVEVTGNCVTDLSGATCVVPLGQRSEMNVPGRPQQVPTTDTEHGRQEEAGAAGQRGKAPDLSVGGSAYAAGRHRHRGLSPIVVSPFSRNNTGEWTFSGVGGMPSVNRTCCNRIRGEHVGCTGKCIRTERYGGGDICAHIRCGTEQCRSSNDGMRTYATHTQLFRRSPEGRSRPHNLPLQCLGYRL